MTYLTNSKDREVGRYKVSISPVEGHQRYLTHPAEDDLVYQLTEIAHDTMKSHGYSAATQMADLIFEVCPDGLINREIQAEDPPRISSGTQHPKQGWICIRTVTTAVYTMSDQPIDHNIRGHAPVSPSQLPSVKTAVSS